MSRRSPKVGTQAAKVLKVLLDAKGEWLSGQYFLRELYLSQYHARIWDLENRFGWTIEHSEEKDEFGFLSYRIAPKPKFDVEFISVDGVMHARVFGS